VRCPACRTPFEADAGGGLGPRWVLLPLWPWCAGAVVSLPAVLTRLDVSKLLPWVVVLLLLLNLAVSVADARACGRAWAAARARGESASLLDWCGAAHSALGFTWCWLFTLLALGGGRMGSWLGVGLVWGCVLIAPGVFLSGLALTAGAWSDSRRVRSDLRDIVAAYDTLALAYNTCALAVAIWVFVWAFGGGIPWAPTFVGAEIMGALAPGINFSQGRGGYDFLVPALLLVVAALGAGVLSTAAIACRAAGGPPDPVAGLAPARRGDVGRAVRESAAASLTRCPSCGRALALPEALGGALVKCPACAATFRAGPAGQPPRSVPPAEGTQRGSDATTPRPSPPGEGRILPAHAKVGMAPSGAAPDPPPGPSSRTWDVVWLLINLAVVFGLLCAALGTTIRGYPTSIKSLL
jgi:hypothetical protein